MESLEDRHLLSITVNSFIDERDSSITDGDISLRDAIELAPADETIDFDPTIMNGKTIDLLPSLGQLVLNKSLTIDASMLPDGLMIDAGGGTDGVVGNGDGSGVFSINLYSSGQSVTLDSLTITGGDKGGDGGGINLLASNGATFNLINSHVINNAATQGGGIAFQGAGQLKLQDVVLAGNIVGSSGKGGGLFVDQAGNNALVEIRNSQITGNQARNGSANHAGFYIKQSTSTAIVGIHDTVIESNQALGRESNFAAGKIDSNGTITIERSTITGNYAQDDVGGISVYSGGSVSIKESTISDNRADNDGTGSVDGPSGLVLATRGGAQFILEGTTISGNISNNLLQGTVDPINGAGGGIYLYNLDDGGAGSRSVRFSNTTISGNQSDGVGGGIAIVNDRSTQLDVSFESSTIVENVADVNGDGLSLFGLPAVGGGIFVGGISVNTTVTLENTIVAKNLRGSIGNQIDDDLFNPSSISIATSYSLIGISTGANITNITGNQIGVTSPIDPGLADLADNGGPTLTHRPLTNSPVIDAGNPTAVGVPQYDQRGMGFSRIIDGDGNSVARIDIGAVEFDTATPPKVTNVKISSWSATDPHAPHSFNNPLDDVNDFDGTGTQLKTVPVGNADTISITFSEHVNVAETSLKLYGLVFASRPAPAATNPFSYDGDSFTATWRFAAPFAADFYLIRLSDSVTNAAGTPLDGEWINPGRTHVPNTATIFTDPAISEFPSGNDIAGGDFKFVFVILPGDGDLSNSVNGRDFLLWQRNTSGTGHTFIQADYNGDGLTNGADLAFYQANYGLNLQDLRIAADFDGDFNVGATDLALWQANYGTGTTHAQGDADWDGDVDGRDFIIWQRQFGILIDVVV